MIRIGSQATQQRRLDLAPGAWLDYHTMTSIDREAGLAAQRRFMEHVRDGHQALADYGVSEIGDLAQDADLVSGVASLVALVEFGMRCVTGWSGIVDEQGEPLPLNRINLAALLREPAYHAALLKALSEPILALDIEAKKFAPSPNGAPAGA